MVSITDELRDCIRTANRSYEDVRNPYNDREVLHIPEEELLIIADRIDTEHERMFRSLTIDAEPMTDESMAEHGWVRLPVDADGEYIHVGDALTDGEYTFTVYELAVFGDGSWSIRNEEGIAWAACDVTHRASTVEDVLREFADRVCNSGHQWGLDAAGTIAEYAAKLRLAERVGA